MQVTEKPARHGFAAEGFNVSQIKGYVRPHFTTLSIHGPQIAGQLQGSQQPGLCQVPERCFALLCISKESLSPAGSPARPLQDASTMNSWAGPLLARGGVGRGWPAAKEPTVSVAPSFQRGGERTGIEGREQSKDGVPRKKVRSASSI